MLLVMMVVAVSASFLLLRSFNSANSQIQRDAANTLILAQAKDALLAYALTPRGAALGQLPYPDLLDIHDESPTNFDGLADVHCYDTTSYVSLNLGVANRCFGRLPWKTLGMQAPSESAVNEADPFGEMPWYAVSANLLEPCIANKLNPQFLNWTYPAVPIYRCNIANQLPHPWLTVRDAHGNVVSNRVAFVLILPRQRMGTQTRIGVPLGLPRNYLEPVTVASTCTSPCVPGTYDNGSFNPGNQFIVGEDVSRVNGNNLNYTHPYQFNDRVLYVTIDELMGLMQKRALQEARLKLLQFRTAQNYFPYAANLGDSTGACQLNLQSGFLPLLAGTCGSGQNLATFPTWFGNANWQQFIYYAVAPACVSGTNNCNGAGFLSVAQSPTPLTNVQALLIGSGRPVTTVAGQFPDMNTPPFAASAGRNQSGCCVNTLIDYLDSANNTDGNNSYDALGTNGSTIYNDQSIIVAP